MRRMALHGSFGHGRVALVSDEDYDELCSHRWLCRRDPSRIVSDRYYCWRMVRIRRKKRNPRRPGSRWTYRALYLHREIMGCRYHDRQIVDHVNGDTLDCRRENLRIVDDSDSQQNKKGWSRLGLPKGLHPVHRQDGSTCGYGIQITVRGRHVYLGYVRGDQLALGAAIYDIAALLFFGPHARLNGPI